MQLLNDDFIFGKKGNQTCLTLWKKSKDFAQAHLGLEGIESEIL